jgi:hypothetical protein
VRVYLPPKSFRVVFALAVLASVLQMGQWVSAQSVTPAVAIVRLDAQFDQIVPLNATFEKIAEGPRPICISN